MMRRWIAVLLTAGLIFSLMIPAYAIFENNADQYENAMGLLREYKYAEAGEAFEKLGDYADSSRYMMYCRAVDAGEKGFYTIAVQNLRSLSGFLDSDLRATYYTGLSWESSEDYERAENILNGITLYRDVSDRIQSYPEKINARDYRKADAAEKAGELEAALKAFTALGSYSDSAARAETVREKIHARDYAAAEELEKQGKLEEALEAFRTLGDYSDSPERVKTLQKKIADRDAAAEEAARAIAYNEADAAEKAGDYAAAYKGFSALGKYRDSAERAAAVHDKGNYAQAEAYMMQGKFREAYNLYKNLGEYEDSKYKAYSLSILDVAGMEDRGNGIAVFQFHGSWGLVNMNTGTVVSPIWEEVGRFNDLGLATACKNGKYGYINQEGEEVVPCRFYAVSEFSRDGLCTVAVKTTSESSYSTKDYYIFGIYDSKGHKIISPSWRKLGSSENSDWGDFYNVMSLNAPFFSDGKTIAQNEQGLYGYIDRTGKIIGEIRWNSILSFSENLGAVTSKGLIGFIDKDGNVVIEPQYTDALPFSEGLAAVKTGSKWQYINRDNEVIIPAAYNNVTSFSNGMADVYSEDNGWQVIDNQGRVIKFVDREKVIAYDEALELMKAEKYDEAYDRFMKASGYMDAEELMKECSYISASSMFDAKQYGEAQVIFKKISGYKDADDLALQCIYNPAKELLDAGKYEEAREGFLKVKGYKDADDLALQCIYNPAKTLFDAGDYKEAREKFQKISGYKDADDLAKECTYLIAMAQFKAENYKAAGDIFSTLSGYKDADDLALQCVYNPAKALFEAEKYEEARKAFLTISGYKDADDLAKESLYMMAKAQFDAGKYKDAGVCYLGLKGYKDADVLAMECAYLSAKVYFDEGRYKEARELFLAISGYKDADNLAADCMKKKPDLMVGSYIKFGMYPQTEKGTDQTPIEWLILDYDISSKKALLLSRYGLDARPYHDRKAKVTWENSNIRNWLNKNFLNMAFTVEEQKLILLSNIDNTKANGNPNWKTTGGKNTKDRVFLLSYNEARKYLGLGSENKKKELLVTPTEYAVKQGAYVSSKYKTEDGKAGWWWLRSPGFEQFFAAFVGSDGSLRNYSVQYNEKNDLGCVRPALWLNMESGIF